MSYPGGKGASGVVQKIINQQPPHRWYIEPFLGAGAVMRAKRPAEFQTGIDLDCACVAHFEGRCDRLLVTDGISFLECHQASFAGDTLIYCDPPYPHETRSHKRIYYRYELTDLEHQRFLRIAKTLPCMVQISSYRSDLYVDQLRDWRCITFDAMTRGGRRTEYLWMNYPEPSELHDYRFAGEDYRQRERIRRKVTRWTNRLAKLPEIERRALLAAVFAGIAKNEDAGSHDKVSDAGRRPSMFTTAGSGDHTTPEMVVTQ